MYSWILSYPWKHREPKVTTSSKQNDPSYPSNCPLLLSKGCALESIYLIYVDNLTAFTLYRLCEDSHRSYEFMILIACLVQRTTFFLIFYSKSSSNKQLEWNYFVVMDRLGNSQKTMVIKWKLQNKIWDTSCQLWVTEIPEVSKAAQDIAITLGYPQ